MGRSRSRSPRRSPRRSRSPARRQSRRSPSMRRSPQRSQSPRHTSRRSRSARRSPRKSPPRSKRSRDRGHAATVEAKAEGRSPQRRQRSRSRKEAVEVGSPRKKGDGKKGDGKRIDPAQAAEADKLYKHAESMRVREHMQHKVNTKADDARRMAVILERNGMGVVNLDAGPSDAQTGTELKQEKMLTGAPAKEKKQKKEKKSKADKAKKKAKKAKKKLKKAEKLLKKAKQGKKSKKSSSSDSSSESSESIDPFEFVMESDFANGARADAHHAEARIANWLGITARMAKMDNLTFVSREDDEEQVKQSKFEEEIAAGKRDASGKLKENRDNDWICQNVPSIDGKVCEGRNFPKNDFCYACKAPKPRDATLLRNVGKLTCGDKASQHGRGSYNGKVCSKFMSTNTRNRGDTK